MNKFTTGRLVEPKTKSFNDKVNAASIVVFGGKKHAWIGINAKAGPWIYTSNGTELVFENWDQGEPNDDSHDCVHFWRKGKWADYPCYAKLFFICELSFGFNQLNYISFRERIAF